MSEFQTRAATDEYRSNFDRIFGKKSEPRKQYRLEVAPANDGLFKWTITPVGENMMSEAEGTEQSVGEAARVGAEAIQRRLV